MPNNVKTKLSKEIRKILSDMHPECEVEGHRVHTTLNKDDELWPEWGSCAYGIAGGFVHFEDEDDMNAWTARQKKAQAKGKQAKMNGCHEGGNAQCGRCVNACGPIGFCEGAA